MAQFLEFLAQQWVLVLALLTAVGLLIYHESRRGGKGISPQQLAALVNREQAVVVDLRDSGEFRKGHIVDAVNIPYAALKERQGELEACRERPVVLVCKMGQHASAAGKQLAAQGFRKVFRLSGGIGEWQHQQMPLVRS